MRDFRIPRYKCIVCGKTPSSFRAFIGKTSLGICTKCCDDYRFTEEQVMEKLKNQREEMINKYPRYAKPFSVRHWEMNKNRLDVM